MRLAVYRRCRDEEKGGSVTGVRGRSFQETAAAADTTEAAEGGHSATGTTENDQKSLK